MGKTEEKVMAVVEEELRKNPGATVDELYAKAREASSGVGKLTRRQFNARYPLQVKRRLQGRGGRKGGRRRGRPPRARREATPAVGNNRDAIRDAFHRFASDLAAAEARKDLVKVLANVDKYVDLVVKATS